MQVNSRASSSPQRLQLMAPALIARHWSSQHQMLQGPLHFPWCVRCVGSLVVQLGLVNVVRVIIAWKTVDQCRLKMDTSLLQQRTEAQPPTRQPPLLRLPPLNQPQHLRY